MHESRIQSAIDTARGSGAELIHELGMALYIGAGLIFVVVMILACYGIFANARRVNTNRWIIGGGIAFPILVLTILLAYSLIVGNRLDANVPEGALRIHVIGKQWWWEIRYEQPGEPDHIVLANEIHIPVGQRIELLLSTSDVIHSFWVPALAGKVDMIPGRTNRLAVEAHEAGVYRGQCAEYCGGQHALMSVFVIADEQSAFDAWLARQAQPASVPKDPFLQLGYEQFFRGECQDCHTIRGTAAAGTDGPDLTHIGSRHSIAAATLTNHIGTMAGWIAGAQDIKPGNNMPDTNTYNGRELRAVSAWLGSLQ